jgi:hypothetical protein
VLVVAAQRGGPGSKAGGQPVRQPLPGAQQHRCGSAGCDGRNPVRAWWASARVR